MPRPDVIAVCVDTSDWAVRVPIGYRVGRWEVTAAIATGSWGSVYEARSVDRRLSRPVALKLLPTGTVTPRQLAHLAQMAQREAALHQALSHPRLIRAYEVLTVEDRSHPDLDGTVVLVMERARCSLADVLQRNGDRPVAGAPRLVEQICEGLAHMHRTGWVHGDLKPGNVLVMDDGSLRLGDFGLSAELEGTHAYLPPMGSSDYVPPERWTERLSGRGLVVRPSADIWALGVIAYQLFAGVYPFAGSGAQARATAAAHYAAGHHRLLFPSLVPAQWRELIEDCLAPTHQQRRRHDAITLLTRVQALRTKPFHAAWKPTRLVRGRRIAVLAAGLAVTMAALSASSNPPMGWTGYAAAARELPRPSPALHPFAFADVDGDGRADLIGVSGAGHELIVYRSDGWGTTSLTVGRDRRPLSSGFGDASRTAFADIDGDGRADLIGISGRNNDLIAYRNQGWDGSSGVYVDWDRQYLVSGFGELAGLKFADIDGDGRADLIAVTGVNNDITAYRNQGWSTAAAFVGWDRRTVASGFGGPQQFKLADIDGDGRADLVGDSGVNHDLTAYRNQGWNSASGVIVGWDRRSLTTGFGPLWPLKIVDADGDGRADLIGISGINNDMTAYRNQGWDAASGIFVGWDRKPITAGPGR